MRTFLATLALAAPALASAAAAASTVTTVSYVEFFSGVGGYWNASTSKAFTTAVAGQYASADPTQTSVSPQDFPVALGVYCAGVTLSQFNRVQSLQNQVGAAIAQDAGVSNATTQVQLGAFGNSKQGLYLPFTVDNLGTSAAAAAAVVQKLFTSGALITTSSALSTTLATALGAPCALSYAPPTMFPAGQPAAPSVGVMLQVAITLPNATMAEEAVNVNMFDTGLLIQELAVQGITLGPLYGGAVVQVHTLASTPGSFAPSAYPSSAPQNVFLAPSSETAHITKSGAASRGVAALGVALAAALAACAL
jgi:hypothetical protein